MTAPLLSAHNYTSNAQNYYFCSADFRTPISAELDRWIAKHK